MQDKVIPIRSAGAARAPAPLYDGGPLADVRGRGLRDLRISVTDRCNFRCVYCMPREVFDNEHKFLPHSAILSFEEIARLARVFVGMGVQKIRKQLPRWLLPSATTTGTCEVMLPRHWAGSQIPRQWNHSLRR